MIPNLRDVGETVNILAGRELLLEGQLYRGGTINKLFSKDELPPVATIVNLRKGPDQRFEDVDSIHIPATDTLDNYLTHNHRIQAWINHVLEAICITEKWPILIHCTSGKDRTGVVIATILASLGFDRDTIREEYVESEGIRDESHIEIALDGILSADSYIYDTAVTEALRERLLYDQRRCGSM